MYKGPLKNNSVIETDFIFLLILEATAYVILWRDWLQILMIWHYGEV